MKYDTYVDHSTSNDQQGLSLNFPNNVLKKKRIEPPGTTTVVYRDQNKLVFAFFTSKTGDIIRNYKTSNTYISVWEYIPNCLVATV